MEILFIYFNIHATIGINNGIAILSAVLKSHGYKTNLLLIDDQKGYSFDLKHIKSDILRIKPDLVATPVS